MKTSTLRLLAQHGPWALLLAALVTGAPARAGVTFDGTMGPTGSLSGNMTVPASMGAQRGANLFHSFGAFNIFTGESLYFTPAGSSAAISNVISRVTGGSLSAIDGVLGSSISGANLFLINPSGIAFGPNARLDVSGSFYASTANYLKLADGGRFDASTPSNTVLTVAAPAAFGFLGPTPAGITVSGSILQVPNGQSLGLIGGDISVSGAATLAAPGGAAHLVSAASPGEANIGRGAFDVSSFAALGAVSISGGSTVDVSEPVGETMGGGTVYIRGGSLVLERSSVLARPGVGSSGGVDISVSGDVTVTGALIDTSSPGTGRAGDINVTAAGTMSMDNSYITSEAFGDGDAGNILINAGALNLTNFAEINSSGGIFLGRGGNITINTPGTMSMDDSRISSEAFGDGDAGNILINAGNLNLANFAEINSSGSFSIGRGGNITINAPGAMSMDGFARISSEAFGDGDAGNILITAGALSLTNGAKINSSGAFFGVGRGGNITINTPGTMLMDDSRISSEAFGDGDAGNILINAGSLNLTNGAEINSSGAFFGVGRGGGITISAAGTMSMDGFARISSEAFGDGDAGNILITAGALNLTDFSQINSSGGIFLGRGGDITISAAGTMSMDGFARISSEAFGDGDAGNILINAGGLDLANFAEINSSGALFGVGRGGGITINTPGTMSMDSAHITSEAFSDGDAGNILITAGALNLANFSRIASAGGDPGFIGRGGNITINTAGAMSMDRSRITSEAFGDGDAGNILVSAAGLNLANFAEVNSSGALFGVGRGGGITINTPGTMSMDSSRITSEAFGDGDAGNILIGAGALNLTNFAAIVASTRGAGGGGNISVASPLISLAEFGTIRSETSGSGNAGSVTIDAGDLRMTSGGSVSAVTTDAGTGGDVVINANRIDISGGKALPEGQFDPQRDATDFGFYSGIYVNAQGAQTGDGGRVSIRTGELIISDAGTISGITTGAANAGNVRIEAGRVRLESGGLIATSTAGSGNAGNITMNVAESVVIDGRFDAQKFAGFTPRESPNSGIVSTATLNLNPNVNMLGNGGTVTLTAPSLSIANHGEISTAADLQGTGGSVAIDASNILMTDHARISAQSLGAGNAGDIRIRAGGDIRMVNDSAITTEALLADGGNIDISAGFKIHLTDSRITTSVGTGFGNGGNITIDPVFVILDNSRIIANAFGGRGGNISIVTQQFIADPRSIVDASSALGIDGNVEISSPNTDVGANLGVLPATLFDVSALMRDSCAARAGMAAANSFIGVGRGGLPLDPESAAYSTYVAPGANRPAANVSDARAKADNRGARVVYLADRGALQDWAFASPCRQ